VTNEILDKFIATKNYLAVLFFREDDEKSTAALQVGQEPRVWLGCGEGMDGVWWGMERVWKER
jgi:hypothetical protein